jgi:purine-cytosine permease-like protein
MIVSGAATAATVVNLGGTWVWDLVIGALIVVWIMVGIRNLNKLNLVAMNALFILTIVMSMVIFGGNQSPHITSTISFGAAVELSVAMPLVLAALNL